MTTVAEPNVNLSLVQQCYAALRSGDFETFEDFLAPDVVFDIHGMDVTLQRYAQVRPTLDGVAVGREAVLAMARRNAAQLHGETPVILASVAQDNRVAFLFEEAGTDRETGRPYHARISQWITLNGSQIQRIDELVSPIP